MTCKPNSYSSLPTKRQPQPTGQYHPEPIYNSGADPQRARGGNCPQAVDTCLFSPLQPIVC